MEKVYNFSGLELVELCWLRSSHNTIIYTESGYVRLRTSYVKTELLQDEYRKASSA